MTLEVQVEERHIKGAQIKSATADPLARALGEQYGGQWSVKTLGKWNVAFQWPGGIYNLTPKALDFVRAFDEGQLVTPGTFTIEHRDGRVAELV